MAVKRDLWKIQKRLEQIEESLSGIKQELGQYYTKEEQVILTYEASIGRMDTVLEHMSEDEIRTYAALCQKYLDFGWEVELCMSERLSQMTAIRVGVIPPVLMEAGCEEQDMYITQKHLRNILHSQSQYSSQYHEIDVRQLKQLPELLANPLAVISDAKMPDTVVVVLDAVNKHNEQIIVPMKKNGTAFYQGNKVDANFILSTYGKKNILHYMDKALSEKRVLYLDKKISTSSGQKPLQLRQFLNTDTYKEIIPHREQNVNSPEQKKGRRIKL